jgi:predicted aspartyl protease
MPRQTWKIRKSVGSTIGGRKLDLFNPIVKVSIAPSPGFLPSPGNGLIDTGADVSCIDKGVAAALKLNKVDEVLVNTPDGKGKKPKPIYDAAIRIEGLGRDLKPLCMVEADLLASQGIVALIGTDILNAGSFHYDGKKGEFTLELP